MVGSRCVVQGCSNRSNKAAGLALHASPSDRTRDQWVRFVRIKRKNFFPQPQAKFVICSVHFELSKSFSKRGAIYRKRFKETTPYKREGLCEISHLLSDCTKATCFSTDTYKLTCSYRTDSEGITGRDLVNCLQH